MYERIRYDKGGNCYAYENGEWVKIENHGWESEIKFNNNRGIGGYAKEVKNPECIFCDSVLNGCTGECNSSRKELMPKPYVEIIEDENLENNVDIVAEVNKLKENSYKPFNPGVYSKNFNMAEAEKVTKKRDNGFVDLIKQIDRGRKSWKDVQARSTGLGDR